eukprot:gene12468-biopygen4776
MLSALFVPQRAKLDRAGPGGTATSQILKCKGGGFTSSRDAYNEAVELWIGGYAAAARSTVGVAVGSAAPDVREALQALRARITDRAARALVLHRGWGRILSGSGPSQLLSSLRLIRLHGIGSLRTVVLTLASIHHPPPTRECTLKGSGECGAKTAELNCVISKSGKGTCWSAVS